MSRFRALVLFLSGFVAWMAPLGDASAAPASVGATADTRSSTGGGRFDWPELVVGGNAVSGLFPVQFGIVGYLPKGRFAFQYDRQIRRAHWVYGGVAVVFDRGGYRNFRMDTCGLESQPGSCGKGGVVGVDAYVGYAHKFFLHEHPYLVPILRVAAGYSFFALPQVGGGAATRLQSRTQSTAVNLRPGGGVRLFFTPDLGIGADLNLPLGVLIHREVPLDGDRRRDVAFQLGIEVLPLIVEYRF